MSADVKRKRNEMKNEIRVGFFVGSIESVNLNGSKTRYDISRDGEHLAEVVVKLTPANELEVSCKQVYWIDMYGDAHSEINSENLIKEVLKLYRSPNV